MIGIYKITSPSGKIYIGQSTNIEKRWKIHRGLYGISFSKLKRSLCKYGFENHIFDIIEECKLEELNEKETYWIDFCKSNKNGLNIEEGGKGGHLSQETRNKISVSKINHICYQTSERGEKISIALKGRKNTWKKGKEKKGKKQEEIFRNNIKRMKSKAILQYDLQGNFIKEWDSIREASTELNINEENIGSVVRGITKTAKKYIWKFKIIQNE